MHTPSPWNRALQRLPLVMILGIILAGCLLPSPVRQPAQEQSTAPVELSFATLKSAPRGKRLPLVALADSKVAHRMRLTPQQAQEIARIDSELDRKAQEIMEAEIARWQQRGGFHVEPAPDFHSPSSPCGRRLAAMKREAEAQIAALLSPEEKGRWSQEGPPLFRPMPAQIQNLIP